MKREVRVQFLHDWYTHTSLQNSFERGIWVWRITTQQLTCRWFPIPADLQPAAHTRILSVCPTGPVHGPLDWLPVHRSEWRRAQSYGSKNTRVNHYEDMCSYLGSWDSFSRKRDSSNSPTASFFTRISCSTSRVATSLRMSAWAFTPDRQNMWLINWFRLTNCVWKIKKIWLQKSYTKGTDAFLLKKDIGKKVYVQVEEAAQPLSALPVSILHPNTTHKFTFTWLTHLHTVYNLVP